MAKIINKTHCNNLSNRNLQIGKRDVDLPRRYGKTKMLSAITGQMKELASV